MGKGNIIWLLSISSESISVPLERRRLCLIYKETSSQQQAFSIETAEALLKAFNMRKEFGFNLDPANLLWCLVDPVIFVKRLSSRIYSVHAKDGELVKENLGYSGSAATGDWRRFDRGFRFRVVG